MSKLKRQELFDGGHSISYGYDCPNGKWVDAEAALAIEQERDALRVENKRLKELTMGAITKSPIQEMGQFLGDLLDDDQWANVEPYLDSALAHLLLAQSNEDALKAAAVEDKRRIAELQGQWFNCVVVIADYGKIDTIFSELVHNMDTAAVEQVVEALPEDFTENDFEFPKHAAIVTLRVTDCEYDPGQESSCPDSGAMWDFPPYWMMKYSIIEIDGEPTEGAS